MKIVHITPFYGEQYGGSERYVSNLVKHHSRNHDVHIFSTTKYFSQRGTVKKDGYYLHRFYAPITIWNINPVSFILHKIKNIDADLFHIHSYLYFISNQAIIAKYFSKVPTILHLHGGVGLPPYKTTITQKAGKIFYDKVIGKLMIRGANIVASVSKFDIVKAQELFGNKNTNFVYLPNGVDIDQFSPKKTEKQNEKFNVLYVGDMEPWKGIDYMVNIINNENFNGLDINFQFIGQGSLTPELLKIKHKNKLSIEYLGEKAHSEIPQYMQNADMFIFPSKWEGTPTVVLEAMSSELPVLSTAVGDIPLIIQHKKNGMILKKRNGELTDSINLLKSNREFSNNISRAARKFVANNYDFTKIAETVEKAYFELVS